MLITSIVLYKHSHSEIIPLINLLQKSEKVSVIFLIDNSPTPTPEFNHLQVNYIFTGKSLGSGAVAHYCHSPNHQSKHFLPFSYKS